MTKSDSGRRNASRRWKDFMLPIRRMHLYFGLFMLPWILLYSITGFLFNHPTYFSDSRITHFEKETLVGTPVEQSVDLDAVATQIIEVLNTAAFENSDPHFPYKRVDSETAYMMRPVFFSAKGESWSNPDNQIFIPLTTAQERLFGVSHLSSILAQVRSADDYNESLFDIETILRRNHRLAAEDENDFRVRRQDVFLATIQETNKELAGFIMVIALVSLLVGGIGIANVMLISVTERIREIGIRRAIGAKKVHILIQFLTESMIFGLLGGLLDTTGGLIFNHLRIGDGMMLPWEWLVYSFVICAGIGVVADIYPALWAANRNVIEALRYE